MKDIQLDKFVLDSNLGYYYIYYPTHELANKSGKVYLHRYVACKREGRILHSKEIVHHINGDKTDNREDNLEILTAKEHAETHFSPIGYDGSVKCSVCGKDIYCLLSRKNKSKSGNIFCSPECSSLFRRKFEIDKKTLSELVWKHPTTKIAKMFNVSDKAIEKRCKFFDIEKPPRGYWRKIEAQLNNKQ